MTTNEYPTKAYGATATDSGVWPMEITRRGLRHDDVMIEITHCGICHSDLHSARNDWGGTVYPIVPGHEIVGVVSAVGTTVTRHKVGDLHLHEVTPAQLAVDGQIKQRTIPYLLVFVEHKADGPNYFLASAPALLRVFVRHSMRA